MFILDRIEGQTAVLENEHREIIDVSIHVLSPKAVIGGVYHYVDGKYCLNTGETDQRKNRIHEKMKKIFKQ